MADVAFCMADLGGDQCVRQQGHAGPHVALGADGTRQWDKRSPAVYAQKPSPMELVRELHALGATHVKVGDIEADFPQRLPDLQPERVRQPSPEDVEKEMRRIMMGPDGPESDEDPNG